MSNIRKELAALIAWDEAGFPCVTRMEIEAVGIRIVRMAELLRKARQIAAKKRKKAAVPTINKWISLADALSSKPSHKIA
jgi:hypothetical protein